MSIGGACKAIVLPLVSVAESVQNKEDFNGNGEQRGGGDGARYLAYIIHILITVTAGYLAWTCNAGTSTILRILYTILSVFFSWFYLIYYVIVHVLMARPCGTAGMGVSRI